MCTPRTVLRLESGEAVQPDAVVGAGLTQLLLGGANLATTTTAAATAWTCTFVRHRAGVRFRWPVGREL